MAPKWARDWLVHFIFGVLQKIITFTTLITSIFFLINLTFMFYSMDTCESNHGQQLPIMLLSIFSFQLVTRPVWRLQQYWRHHFRNLLEYQKTRGSSFTYRDSRMASRRISGTRSSSGLRHELIDLSHHLRQERLYVQNEKTQVSLLQ